MQEDYGSELNSAESQARGYFYKFILAVRTGWLQVYNSPFTELQLTLLDIWLRSSPWNKPPHL